MKVFISWSGTASREVAEALRWWLPKVIQGTNPFVSAKDIDKGANWTSVLSAELADTDFGIICVTPENMASPWLNYEAGAISKSVDSRTCPVLLGVTKAELSGPLKQMQVTDLEYEDMFLLLRSLNKTAGSPLLDADLEEQAQMWWPKLLEKTGAIAIPPLADVLVAAPEPAKPESSESELLLEVLSTVRRISRRIDVLDGPQGRPARDVPPGPDLLSQLRNEGLRVDELMAFVDRYELRSSEPIPEVLPGKSWPILLETARKRQKEIRLTDLAGREITIGPDGSASEPPF